MALWGCLGSGWLLGIVPMIVMILGLAATKTAATPGRCSSESASAWHWGVEPPPIVMGAFARGSRRSPSGFEDDDPFGWVGEGQVLAPARDGVSNEVVCPAGTDPRVSRARDCSRNPEAWWRRPPTHPCALLGPLLRWRPAVARSDEHHDAEPLPSRPCKHPSRYDPLPGGTACCHPISEPNGRPRNAPIVYTNGPVGNILPGEQQTWASEVANRSGQTFRYRQFALCATTRSIPFDDEGSD
jgi:hypothetical protein